MTIDTQDFHVSAVQIDMSYRRFHRQTGQAALEALVLMLALAVLWVCIAWLGRIQDLALHASHASRYSAFMATRYDSSAPAVPVRQGVFEGPGNQWSDRNGQRLQDSKYQDIQIRFTRNHALAEHAQIGGEDARLTQLREDWGSADTGVLSAQVNLVPRNFSSQQVHERSLFKFSELDKAYPVIRRHTSILTGAAHASDDAAAADRIAESGLAWSDAAENSYRIGHQVNSVASRVDAAWGRPQPVFDWLQPWADLVPHFHLQPVP